MLDTKILEDTPDPILANAIQKVLTLLVHGNQKYQAVETTKTGLAHVIWIIALGILHQTKQILIISIEIALALLDKATNFVHGKFYELNAEYFMHGGGDQFTKKLGLQSVIEC